MRFIFLLVTLIFIGCSSSNDPMTETSSEDTPSQDQETPEPTGTSIYFPPINSSTWETIDPSDLGWETQDIEALEAFLSENDTYAFMILKEGRIVLESYYNGTTMSDTHPWFSAGKTLTAFTLGIAEQEGYLSINDATSDYLGEGWTTMTTAQEQEITIRNQLTMTSGGDYTVSNTSCTDPECLLYLENPDSFWYYHNAFYTLLQPVMNNAIPEGFDSYFNAHLQNKIGMDGTWIQLGYNRIYFSTARTMARFGLVALNEGFWDTEQLVNTSYFEAMTTPSQDINPSYGYLWWLNGQESHQVPSTDISFSGPLIPNAPDDMIAGLGAKNQKLYVVPSQDLVIIRMGDDAGMPALGPSGFDNELWEKINAVIE